MTSAPQREGLVKKSVRTGFNAPFPADYRASGVLMHVTSLPSRYGIGDTGPTAFAWIDCLVAAGQSWWQVLPLGPTGYGHSPYQALSSFAANPLVISPEQLIEDGLLTADEVSNDAFPSGYVDFERLIPFKERVLDLAWKNFGRGKHPDLRSDFEEFCAEKGAIQDDTALFMAIRSRHRGAPFQEWPAELVRRERSSLERVRSELREQIEQFRFGQFLVLRQWKELKRYANDRGVWILGDLPIFVSPDSADVWAAPDMFLLDNHCKPRVVAGVPPDYFSAQGQLWGNPLYDWEALRRTGYRWWINRLAARLEYLDAIRIDHFRGFEAAWQIPAGAATAQGGHWAPGPGADFFENLRRALEGLPLLAEDLGVITREVEALRDRFQLPGMRVLQFAFGGDANNPHLPHHLVHNGVVYTGTHDNDTTRGWYETLPEHERRNLWNYLQRSPGEPQQAVWGLIELAASSVAALAMVPFQDILGLGSDARMNTPGQAAGQWRWRWASEDLSAEAGFQRLHEITEKSDRLAGRQRAKPNEKTLLSAQLQTTN
jgi:4-alpha-glucanotransferase